MLLTDADTDSSSDDEDTKIHSVDMFPTDPMSQAKTDELERLMLLVPFIERDAFERYLLIHHFIMEISKQWSAFLFCTLFISLLSTGLTYYLMYSYGKIEWGFLMAIVLETLFFVYPVACLGYANKHVKHILYNFRVTAPDDYAVLGDRERWREFTDDAPLYWCIFGVPITDTVLTAYVSTAATVAPVIITALTVFSNGISIGN